MHKHAAVAASLAFADDFGRCAPLEVQLEVAEILFRADAAGVRLDGHDPILDLPADGLALLAVYPFANRVVFQPQQNDGVGRRRNHRIVHIRRRNDFRLRRPELGHVVRHRRGIGVFFGILTGGARAYPHAPGTQQ